MNEAFATVIGARDSDRLDLFLGCANRLGTAVQNVEKDFWVCWTLDVLFNGMDHGGPRLLFKGGTSLSKAFDLIPRFSEDIDITVFRDDLGHPIEVAELDGLSGKQRRARLDALREACQAYIQGPMASQLSKRATEIIGAERYRLEPDPEDKDRQTLLLWYPAVSPRGDGYIRSAVKIESGARSALDPHTQATVSPYVAQDIGDIDLTVGNVTTVRPERTLWDKITILHGLRQWFERRGELRHAGQRVSRHYFDVYKLMQNEHAREWIANRALGADCVQHARFFFGSPDLNLEAAMPGTLTLLPVPAMHDALLRDYEAMAGMVFGGVPPLNEVLAGIAETERIVNE